MMWVLHAQGASLEVTNEYGGTVLMSAVHFGRADDVTRLVAAGLDVNAANHRGDTPLTLAASRDDLPLVKTLVGLGAKADARGTRLDTPLIRAAHFRRLETVSYLLDNRLGDLHAVNRRGDSALLEACRAGAYRVAEVRTATTPKAPPPLTTPCGCVLSPHHPVLTCPLSLMPRGRSSSSTAPKSTTRTSRYASHSRCTPRF